jgi:hypothetical protein
VFLLTVLRQRKRWPEMHQRQRVWFHVLDAAQKIKEPERPLPSGVERSRGSGRVVAEGMRTSANCPELPTTNGPVLSYCSHL